VLINYSSKGCSERVRLVCETMVEGKKEGDIKMAVMGFKPTGFFVDDASVGGSE